MTPQFRLSKHQITDWQIIRDLDEAALRHGIEELKKTKSVPVLPIEIGKKLSTSLDAKGGSESLLRQLLSLHGLVRQLRLSTEQVFTGLSASLRAEASWSEEEWNRWNSVSKLVRELFDLEIIRLSAKALDLSYEHSELLQRARILTDIRPVFNDDASVICGTVISHSLLLRYDNLEGTHVLNLALDEDDIKSLIKQCERSLKKSGTAKALLENKAEIATIIPGKGDE